jgi:polyhydroxyalkanoate synthesis repressor PhaR
MIMPSRRNEVSIIKKYANRRLYHTEISQYITLDDVAEMVRRGEDLKVVDARTGQDLTGAILTQIIVEQEAKGDSLLPIKFLRQVIKLYSDNLRPVVPQYLDHAIDTLMNNQEQVTKYWTDQIGSTKKVLGKDVLGQNVLSKNIPILPTQAVQKFNSSVEDIARQNLTLLESAMKMFSPFVQTSMHDKKQKIDHLRQQLKTIQIRINELERMTD